MSQVEVGKAVPEFSAESNQGTIRLSELAGQRLVLYFYPKDSTPGCTTQAQGFRDLIGQLPTLKQVLNMAPKVLRSAPCQENILEGDARTHLNHGCFIADFETDLIEENVDEEETEV